MNFTYPRTHDFPRHLPRRPYIELTEPAMGATYPSTDCRHEPSICRYRLGQPNHPTFGRSAATHQLHPIKSKYDCQWFTKLNRLSRYEKYNKTASDNLQSNSLRLKKLQQTTISIPHIKLTTPA